MLWPILSLRSQLYIINDYKWQQFSNFKCWLGHWYLRHRRRRRDFLDPFWQKTQKDQFLGSIIQKTIPKSPTPFVSLIDRYLFKYLDTFILWCALILELVLEEFLKVLFLLKSLVVQSAQSRLEFKFFFSERKRPSKKLFQAPRSESVTRIFWWRWKKHWKCPGTFRIR